MSGFRLHDTAGSEPGYPLYIRRYEGTQLRAKRIFKAASIQAMAIVNRKARHDYHILENFEAGMILTGPEVKSIRLGQASLAEAHCIVRNGKVLLIGCHINPYRPAAMNNPGDPSRTRELLLHKAEVRKLIGKLHEKGLTLIPLKLFFNARGYAKLELGLARGKKLYDKRQAMKERDVKRDLARNYKAR